MQINLTDGSAAVSGNNKKTRVYSFCVGANSELYELFSACCDKSMLYLENKSINAKSPPLSFS